MQSEFVELIGETSVILIIRQIRVHRLHHLDVLSVRVANRPFVAFSGHFVAFLPFSFLVRVTLASLFIWHLPIV